MKRGDVILAVFSGDYGKPRPAVIVQGDAINDLGFSSVVVCPMTSAVSGAPIVRVAVEPDSANGLTASSEIMAEKVVSVRRDRLRRSIGRLNDQTMAKVDDALLMVLGFV